MERPAAEPLSSFLFRSPRMVEIAALLRRLAATSVNVLLSGESGTGKDLAAHALHVWGPRASGPLIKIDCPSIPAELLESELFGHERGAFTGAREGRRGKLEMAQGGTVLLDQVSELSPPLQAKLLRVVEEKRFERVGGNRTVAVDVRFVASTNQNLKEAVTRGAFRQDLFHRLSVFHAELPPLRDRPEDVPLLAAEFVERERSRLAGTTAREISPEALAALAGYAWPGNVRELKAVVLRALLAATGPHIERTDLPEELLSNPTVLFAGPSGRRPTLAELERDYVELILRHARGNTTLAARILGISRKALWEKRRRYRLD